MNLVAPTRRNFLRAAGAMLPLPFLASLHANAATQTQSHPLVVFRAANGVTQAELDEPERFWPEQLGPLTQASLEAIRDDRTVGELARHADRLLMVRGTSFCFGSTDERHANGGNQLLTAMRPGPYVGTVMSYAQGESIDNWVARQSPINGGEPLTLFTGRRSGFGDEVLSYRGPNDLRSAESDPWLVYQRLTGRAGQPALRGSVNDLVLDQLSALFGSPRLSSADKDRLQLHLDSVRDIEVVGCRLATEIETAMSDLSGYDELDVFRMDVATLHCDLIALVLGCDAASAVTFQLGDRADATNYEFEGVGLPGYHGVSHRLFPDASLPAGFDNCADVHTAINRLHLRLYAHLLDRLEENDCLARSVVVFTSDVATGNHSYQNIPWIVAGAGDGTLRQGQYVDAGEARHNKLLNTLLTATGHRAADGGPVTDFGSDEVAPGVLDVMMT